jgi:ferritin-like metal-binding protein YciE
MHQTKHEDVFVDWLKDAYAMEHGQIQTLKNHCNDAKQHPELESHLRAHLGQTERHADLIKQCIERHGEKPSVTKNVMGTVTGAVSGIASGASKDELVKNALQDYAAEHFEIGCYKSLITGARAVGDMETAQVCEQILHEEEEMADWLESNIPTITSRHLAAHA